MINSTLGGRPDSSLVSNNFGFMRFPLDFNPYDGDADIVITGVPFDLATTGRSGARHGPEAIRRASVNFDWEGCRYPWNFDIRQRRKIVDCGDLVYDFGDGKDFTVRLQQHAEKLIRAGKIMLSLGGDHFITLPLLRAHAAGYGKLALVHFDAHTDTYAGGPDLDHGTMFYRAPREGLLDSSHSVQIGIRTEFALDSEFLVLDADRVCELTPVEVAARIHERTAGLPVYLSFDIDCLDPAFAPGTGTPVAGGLSSSFVLRIIRSLRQLKIIGMDIVEVNPAYDPAGITALAAANLALDLLYLQACRDDQAPAGH